MTKLEQEIKKYHILGWNYVRGEGSLYGHHPNRCLWDVCGKPSIQWVMEAVKNSKYLDKIAVTTESEEIKKVLRKIGGITIVDRPLWTSYNMPRDYTKGTFKRNKPRSLLSREAPIYNGIYEYLTYYLKETEGYEPELQILIPASWPMLTSEIIDRVIEKFFQDEEAGQVITLSPIAPLVYFVDSVTEKPISLINQAGTNKQVCFPLYGTAPGTLTGLPSKLHDWPLTGKTNYIEVSPEEGLDMHNEEDLFLARCYMKRRLLKEGKEVKWKIGQNYKHKKKGGEIADNTLENK